MDRETIREAFVEYLNANHICPGIQIKQKSKSFVMKVLAVLLKPFCPKFMTNFSTTFGSTIYLNDSMFKETGWGGLGILAHEVRHIIDHRRLGAVRYALSYTFPQCLTTLSLLALFGIWWSNWWLLALCNVMWLLPFPAPFRKLFEFAGYSVSLSVVFWRTNSETAATYVPRYIDNFTGWTYYKMWPFRNSLIAQFRNVLFALRADSLSKYQRQLKNFIQIQTALNV